MKKMWIKKESLYHKPFYKQKLKMTMLGVLLMGIVFFAYQLFSINQLQLTSTPHVAAPDASTSSSNTGASLTHKLPANDNPPAPPEQTARGIRVHERSQYVRNANRTFRCLRSREVFSDAKVNDEYCDCADRSDEPATNACPEGVFYCAHSARHPRAGVDRQTSIPNSRINDGICDCCDGSDEWLPHRSGKTPMCPQRCV